MMRERDRKSLWAINLGLGINILLSAVKTIFGVLGHSPALLAEGINSISDVAYYVVAAIFMRLANKPADLEHPYGHRQLENIASLVVGAFVVSTAVAVFWDAVDKIWDLVDGRISSLGSHPVAFWVALATVAIKIFLFFYVRILGRETGNPVVNALAFDHRNDIFSASAASVGIFLGQRGLPWVDPLAGALVWIGTGAGGIFMGWLADRIGIRRTVLVGGCMIAGGLALSSLGLVWALYIGHGLMIGLLGNGGVYPPRRAGGSESLKNRQNCLNNPLGPLVRRNGFSGDLGMRWAGFVSEMPEMKQFGRQKI